MDHVATVDKFVDVNKRLFAICDERTALEHIASLHEPDAKALATSLWLESKIERQIATGQPVT